jgi:hypothetical protein
VLARDEREAPAEAEADDGDALLGDPRLTGEPVARSHRLAHRRHVVSPLGSREHRADAGELAAKEEIRRDGRVALLREARDHPVDLGAGSEDLVDHHDAATRVRGDDRQRGRRGITLRRVPGELEALLVHEETVPEVGPGRLCRRRLSARSNALRDRPV